jgi:hypothetical protein
MPRSEIPAAGSVAKPLTSFITTRSSDYGYALESLNKRSGKDPSLLEYYVLSNGKYLPTFWEEHVDSVDTT